MYLRVRTKFYGKYNKPFYREIGKLKTGPGPEDIASQSEMITSKSKASKKTQEVIFNSASSEKFYKALDR